MSTSWVRIGLIYGIGVLAAGQLGIVPPLLPVLQQDLGGSLAEGGLMVSVLTLVGAVLGLPAGAWSEKIGHARALGLGILIMASAAALCAVAHDSTTLMVLRGSAGVGYLLVVVAAPSLLARAAEKRHQPFALSLWGTFVPVGIALAGMLTSSLVGPMDWRAIFAVDAVLLAFALIVAIVTIPQTRGTQHARHRTAIESLRTALPLSLAFFCFALLFLALAGLLPSYLAGSRGMAAGNAGSIVATVTAFGIAGSLAAGWLMRRGISPARLMVIGLIGSTGLAALAFITAIPVPLAVASLALSFALGGLLPAATFASVPLVADDVRAIGPINGLIAQAGSLGSLAGPPVLALWIGWAGWPLAPVLLLVISAIGAASALAIRPTGR